MDGTIYTSHSLFSDKNGVTSRVADLIAKVIRLESRSDLAALDRRRIIYEKEWQATAIHLQTQYQRVLNVTQLAPSFLLTQAGHLVEQFSIMRSLRSLTTSTQLSGLAVSTSIALTTFLQTVAINLGRDSMLQLLSQAAQATTFGPQGSLIDKSACVLALSMQSMMRVAAQELPMMQWVGTDLPQAYSTHASLRQWAQSSNENNDNNSEAVQSSDMHGRSLFANVWHAPLLLVQEPNSSQVRIYNLFLTLGALCELTIHAPLCSTGTTPSCNTTIESFGWICDYHWRAWCPGNAGRALVNKPWRHICVAPWPHWSHKWVISIYSKALPLRLCLLKRPAPHLSLCRWRRSAFTTVRYMRATQLCKGRCCCSRRSSVCLVGGR